MILDRVIDKIGDRNPQIFRELKQRLTAKNIGLTAGGSALSQGFVWFYFNNQLPILDPYSKGFVNINYCLKSNIKPTDGSYRDPICRLDAIGNPMIDWQEWWSDIFTALSWMLPLGLILGTVYLLVADLVQEEKRGTLNFIRLSPQSAQKIFIGKILGVPSLVYLAAALMLPFHLGAGITAGASISLLSGWYVTIGAIWLLLSSDFDSYVGCLSCRNSTTPD
jgi:ABC-type transport system involved in multi-copper enzyme maturation permease subunit